MLEIKMVRDFRGTHEIKGLMGVTRDQKGV